MTSQVFFFSSLEIDSVTDLQWLEWVLALIPPLSPVEHCEVREMSASCFLPGTGSPSLSCAFLCQSHLCLSHLAWQYYPISPISLTLSFCFSLSPTLFKPPPLLWPCIVEQTALFSPFTATSWSYQQLHSLCGPTNVCVNPCAVLM